jgi:membrane glycosyltransferase
MGKRPRRILFGFAVAATTAGGAGVLATILEADGMTPFELAIQILFTILFAWIAASAWTALLGFFTIMRGGDRFTVTRAFDNSVRAPLPADRRTAIVLPTYNEDAGRVFAGLRAIYEDLAATGQLDHFDFYVLSDSTEPDAWVSEELHWAGLLRKVGGQNRLFYRHRAKNIARKSGNIADFCENWGHLYEYMIVLDADSVMAGDTLVDMVRLMEAHPKAGLLQVPPKPVNQDSPFARIQQFASSAYGPVYAAGLHWWALEDGNYWGHNAIIRIAPFVQHCGLPVLPGREPLGGEILSHDFVEAALLRRAGWQVLLAYEMGGSYEESPPTLIDHEKRDRRWCQGNLQHIRLLFARRLKPVSRLHFLMGVMSYLSSPLWLLLLIASWLEAFRRITTKPVYFFGDNIFPAWPVSYAFEATTLLAFTLGLLYLPKLLGYFALLGDRERLGGHGGAIDVVFSMVLESLFSILLAPIMMISQTRFVFSTLFGTSITWTTQQRESTGLRFREAASAYWRHTLIGVVIGVLTYVLIPDFFWWLSPIVAGLVLAIPFAQVSSRPGLGRELRRSGIFLIPEEVDPPPVLRRLHRFEDAPATLPGTLGAEAPAIERTIVDPIANALHVSLLPPANPSRSRKLYLQGLIQKYEDEGLGALTRTETIDLLADPESMMSLHALVWSKRADAGLPAPASSVA